MNSNVVIFHGQPETATLFLFTTGVLNGPDAK